ncbi:MAG: bifunctional 4-hydroxy-2-oxoglutarate aldolase/2-dehydro-3-deoxy-phosphogluconate aldolase [Dermatophilaceae bacterium]
MSPSLTQHRIIPVVVVNDASRASGLAHALLDGGLPVAEVTFRTPAAPEAIRAMSAYGELLVGAGTVLTPAQVDVAVAAGARFIVSPGLRADVVTRAGHHGVPVIPGAVTPSEIMAAQALDVTTVKFFPAGTYGGALAIKALHAPFRDVQFIPTGGVSPANLADYLSLPYVPAVGGSWMVPADAVDAGDFGRVATLCSQAVSAAAAAGAR